MGVKKKPSPKFTQMYGVKEAQIYQGDPGPDKLRIPPEGHPLYDPSSPLTFNERRVKQIDDAGECSNIVEVVTDPDNGVLYVLDGRETVLNIREVNRRRAAENREQLLMRIAPLRFNEQDAVAHISIRNFHRRQHSASIYGININMQRKKGQPWARICEILDVESVDPEQWCRMRLPLAFCEPEIRAAFDSGELPLTRAKKFGGGAPDGSEALSRQQQLDLLYAEQQAQCERLELAADKPKPVSPKKREKVMHALTNGASEGLKGPEAEIANVVVATLAWVNGDKKAIMKYDPTIGAIIEAALAKPAKKNENEDEEEASS